MGLIKNTKSKIIPVEDRWKKIVQKRLDSLVKPKDSLGRLESLCVKIGSIQKGEPTIESKKIFVLAGDHGVTEEGVSAYPKKVTKKMVRSFVKRDAAINAISEYSDTELLVVDMGIGEKISSKEVIDRKISYGTNNFCKGPAMTRKEGNKAVETGINLIDEYASETDVVGLGDMGIGNTTSSAAIFSTLFDLPPKNVVGRGSGLDQRGINKKIKVVKNGIENHSPFEGALDILCKLGGLEIGGLTGIILGCAAEKKTVLVDGYITLASAALAIEFEPKVADYLIFSHSSGEKGFDIVTDELGVEPILNLDMKLGEGTGAALAMSILDCAVKTYHEMSTFDEAGISISNDKPK